MKVTVSQIAASREGLRLGLRVEDERFGWVKFGTTVLLLDSLTYHERAYLTQFLNDAPRRENWEEDTALDF